jgi:hypothetical protein
MDEPPIPRIDTHMGNRTGRGGLEKEEISNLNFLRRNPLRPGIKALGGPGNTYFQGVPKAQINQAGTVQTALVYSGVFIGGSLVGFGRGKDL